MAIATRTHPQLIVSGTVTRAVEKFTKGKGELYGHFHVLEADGGGMQVVSFVRNAPDGLPVGVPLALVVTVQDDPTYGSQLVYDRAVVPDDLDRLGSLLPSAK